MPLRVLLFLLLATTGCYSSRVHTTAELRARADTFVEAAFDGVPPGSRVGILPAEVLGEYKLDSEAHVTDILAGAIAARGYETVSLRSQPRGTQTSAAMQAQGATHALRTTIFPSREPPEEAEGDSFVDVQLELSEGVTPLASQIWTLPTREFSVVLTVLLILAIPVAIVATIFMIYLEAEGYPVFPPLPHHVVPAPHHVIRPRHRH